MEKHYLDGELYYYKDGKWFTSTFVSVPLAMVSKLNQKFIYNSNLADKTVKELLTVIDGARKSDNYQLARIALEIALSKAEVWDIKYLLPRLTSNYRKIGTPQKAIDVVKDYLNQYGELIWSPHLFNSLAAACCDLYQYEDARKYADMSYKLSGNIIDNELTNVYSRIDKESA